MENDSFLQPSEDAPDRRFRSAPKVWQDIIKSIVDDDYEGEGITYAMIEAAAKDVSHSITRESLRVKMARYNKSGYVRPAIDPILSKRVRGAFWLTERGKEFFKLTERPSAGEEPKTTTLPTSSSKWGHLASKIKPAVSAAR